MRGGVTQRVLLASLAMGAVVLGCFAILAVAYVSLHNEERQDDQAGDVLAASNLLERSVLDLETGLRGYLLSGRTVFLQPYHRAEAAYPAQIRNLDRLTAGQPSLHGRAVRLGDGRTSASWSPTGSAGPATASSRPGTVRRRSIWPRTRRWTWPCWT